MEDKLKTYLIEAFKDLGYILIGSPFALLKEILLTQDAVKSGLVKIHAPIKYDKGVIDCAQRLRKEYGISMLWKKAPFYIFSGIWSRSVDKLIDPKPSFDSCDDSEHLNKVSHLAMKIWLGGALKTLFEYPLERVMSKYLAQFIQDAKPTQDSFLEVFKRLIKKDGIAGLYYGIHIELILNLYFSFATAELEWVGQKILPKPQRSSILLYLLALGLNFVSLFPMDVSMFRYQAQIGEQGPRKSLCDIFKDIYKEEGISGYFIYLLIRILNLSLIP